MQPSEYALNDDIQNSLSDIVNFLKIPKQSAMQIFVEKESINLQLNLLKDQFNIANDPKSHIEQKLFEILNLNEPDLFEQQLFGFLNALQSTFQSKQAVKYIDAIINTMPKYLFDDNKAKSYSSSLPDPLDEGIDELLYVMSQQKSSQKKCERLFEHYAALIDDVSDKKSFEFDKRKDKKALKEINIIFKQLTKKAKKADKQLAKLYKQFREFKSKNHFQFEIDKSFNLITYNIDGADHHKKILFLNYPISNEDSPYVFCKRSPIQFLSAGHFGTIHLCQNHKTKNWQTLLIQDDDLSAPTTTLSGEQSTKPSMHETLYNNQIHQLLNGTDLDEHIANRRQPSIENRLNIARQAALILDKLGHTGEHSFKITPNNFIWDNTQKQLYFCYIASIPQSIFPCYIQDLGKLCMSLFEAIDNLPSNIQLLVTAMLDKKKAKKLSLKSIANQLDEMFIDPSSYL